MKAVAEKANALGFIQNNEFGTYSHYLMFLIYF